MRCIYHIEVPIVVTRILGHFGLPEALFFKNPTCRHFAARTWGAPEFVEYYLSKKISPNIMDDSGETPITQTMALNRQTTPLPENTVTTTSVTMIANNTVSVYSVIMAHGRKRHISAIYNKLLAFSPIVGIFGHRQVGKSTFIAGSVNEYRTLDDVDTLNEAQLNPKQFIQVPPTPPLAIDECQLEPKLFPTLKEWVRTHKKPGQYVLSGSVRFTSRKAIRESLAGRIAIVEMVPFSVSEIMGEPLSDAVLKLFYSAEFSQSSMAGLNPLSKHSRLRKHFELYLTQGGLPGLCFIRSPDLRKNALYQLHDLILSRDLRLVSDIKTSATTLKKVISYIAKQGFQTYNAADVTRLLGLAPQTQKKILSAMESIFLIRRIPVPLRKKEIILLEDQLEESVYAGSLVEKNKSLESAVYRNIRTQFGYRLDKNVQFESYLTRDHARVPIVIKDADRTLGIIVTTSEKPALSETRSAASFLRNHASAKLLYLSVDSIQPEVLDARSLLCSIYSIL